AGQGRRLRCAEHQVPRRQAAAVGQVRGGDPRPVARRARLARHLRHRRGGRARVRQRGRSAPRRHRHDQLLHVHQLGGRPGGPDGGRVRVRRRVLAGGVVPDVRPPQGAVHVVLGGGQGRLGGLSGRRRRRQQPQRSGGAGRVRAVRGRAGLLQQQLLGLRAAVRVPLRRAVVGRGGLVGRVRRRRAVGRAGAGERLLLPGFARPVPAQPASRDFLVGSGGACFPIFFGVCRGYFVV
uniref:Uncharacterized protein n=1 Tax=Triticum urartu TaxID=4572 RepID=A0A8R7TX40_TRIUA